jgi:DNA (cytosine-5)-methyltransferase 1
VLSIDFLLMIYDFIVPKWCIICTNNLLSLDKLGFYCTIMNKRNIEKPRLLDLFCGCGGMSLGFQMAGYEMVGGIDNWKDSLQTFSKNHPDSIPVELDLSSLNPVEIHKKIGRKVDIIVGGPPCQGFSIAGKRNPNDTRNQLYMGFLKFVDYFRPKIFVMENVPNIVSMSEGAILNKILED